MVWRAPTPFFHDGERVRLEDEEKMKEKMKEKEKKTEKLCPPKQSKRALLAPTPFFYDSEDWEETRMSEYVKWAIAQ